jgi:Uma2 family endonuclease
MGLAATTREKPDRIILRDVSWKFYRQFIEEIGDQNVRVTYSNGVMEIMSPLPIHEKIKRLIGRMVETTTLELNIPMGSLGSTTYSHDALEKGLEPDECYYFENEPRIRGKDRIDLTVDPPPDLAIEVDITHRAIRRESIYAAMGVPEIWRFDGEHLDCLLLDDSGHYVVFEYSRCLPIIRVRDLEQFLGRAGSNDETSLMHAFRDWVRTLRR